MQRVWHAHYPPGLPAEAEVPDIAVWQLLERAAQRWPQETALIDATRELSYAELWKETLAVAAWIPAEPGDRVIVRLPNSADFVTSVYGALRAGCIVVPTSPEQEPQLEDSGARIVIDHTPGQGRRKDHGEGPDDTAVLQYTSGTTGHPKAAILTHKNLVANAFQNARWFGWQPDEINLAVLPLYHIWGLSVCLNSTFAVGGTLVIAERFEESLTLDLVERHGATVLYGSATMFHRLLDVPPRPLSTLRHVKAGAMLTQGDLKRRWDARYPHAPLQQGYGLTEASPECHNNPPHRFKPGTVGIPMQGTDCRIAKDGEVLLKGPQVVSGYWNREEETRAAFDEGWLKTGDIGEMDDEGYLTIVDRKKDMLKFRGYTVSPNAVEDCLLAHPAVKEAVVVGRRDERDGDVPTAFVVLADDVDDQTLQKHCRQKLARYEVPREFRRVDEIPKNLVGKPLRRVLRDRLA